MKDCLYRIATTQAGLETGYFLAYDIPMPELVSFQPFTNRRPQSTGGQARQGYLFCTLLWSRLDAGQAYIIEALIEAAETTGGIGNGTLYLTLPRADASAGGVNWVDVSGIAVMPQWETEQQSHGQTYSNVQLRLNNVTVESEPSSAV